MPGWAWGGAAISVPVSLMGDVMLAYARACRGAGRIERDRMPGPEHACDVYTCICNSRPGSLVGRVAGDACALSAPRVSFHAVVPLVLEPRESPRLHDLRDIGAASLAKGLVDAPDEALAGFALSPEQHVHEGPRRGVGPRCILPVEALGGQGE